MTLYTASVPVVMHYLGQAAALVTACRARPEILSARLAPDMFTGAQQFATAAGFALRATYPLAGRAVPDVPSLGLDPDGLAQRFAFAREHLEALDPADFDGAETRPIRHRAGFADLEQPGAAYLSLFAMPNFFFHLTMGFAVLRHAGLEIGKSDFDALHDYPPGFRF